MDGPKAGYAAFPLRGDDDRLAVQRLWRDYLGELIAGAITSRWEWLAERNPAGAALMCVVTNRATGEVVGSAAAHPRALRIAGEPVQGAVLCDFVIDKNHRFAGPAVTLQRALAAACFAKGIDLAYGFPNDAAYPIFARIGYKTVATATMMFRPLRAAHKLRSYVPTPLAHAAGFFVDQIMHAHDFRLFLRQRRGLADVLHERAGAEFEALWEEGKGVFPIAGERTPEHLNWRYADHPIDKCLFFCLTDGPRSRLLGYIAYSAVGGKVNVLDAFWQSPEARQPLFVRFLRRMRGLGHASVSVCHAGDSSVVQGLRQLAFVQSTKRRNLICKIAPEKIEKLGAAAADANRWSLFDGELDI